MKTSPLLSRLAAAGARIGARPEAPDLDAVLTFGDVPSEYAAARERCVLFDATDRGKIRVTGHDATDFLHRILANDVRSLSPSEGNRNLLLTPKGKVTGLFDLSRDEEWIELSCPPGTEESLAEAIDMFVFTEDVTLTACGETHAPLELAGPAARATASEALGVDATRLEELADHATLREPDGTTVTAMRIAGLPGLRIDPGPGGVERTFDSLRDAGAVPAGIVARDILRVEFGSALFGVDVDENVYPQEARLEDAFSLDKGCYIGQEVVAKIDTYGGLNKLLLSLAVEHDDPIPRGTRLLSRDEERRDLGVVTSWSYSFVLDTGLVLAYVKRKHQAPGTEFTLADEASERGLCRVVEFPG